MRFRIGGLWTMAFFKSSVKEKEKKRVQEDMANKQSFREVPKQIPPQGTVISEGIKIHGDITGKDSVQVNGHLVGDITVNHVTIGKRGMVEGSIIAKKIIINGELNGSIRCSELDIMQTGKVKQNIHAKRVVINGEVTGEVLAENSVTITRTGRAQVTVMESQRIIVNGKVEGRILSSELLDIGANGFVEGEISVKNIKTEEGGKVIGTMAPYQPQANLQIPANNATPKSSLEEEGVIEVETI